MPSVSSVVDGFDVCDVTIIPRILLIEDTGPIKQIIRFAIVGAINTAVDLAVLNALILATGTGRRGALYAIFQGIAFLCAMINSYLLNRNWTFSRAPGKSQALEGGEFVLISILGAGVNVGGSSYVATYVEPIRGLVAFWPSIAALVGTALSLGFNFVGYKYFVFSSRVHSRA